MHLKSFLRWARRHFRYSDILEFVVIFLATVIMVVSASQQNAWLGVLAGTYIAFAGVKLFAVCWERGANDKLQAEVFWGLMEFLNGQIFKGTNLTRFTLFCPDPLDSGRIIPRFRFQQAGTDAISEAKKSKVSYGRGEGATGQAWHVAGVEKVAIAVMPEFRDQKALIKHYTQEHNVNPGTAEKISDHMLNVGTIVSIGLVDKRGKFLGVLSIDVSLKSVPGAITQFELPHLNKQVELTSANIALISQTLCCALRSFSAA